MVESNINNQDRNSYQQIPVKKKKSMVRQINEGIMGVSQQDYDDQGFFDPNKMSLEAVLFIIFT